MSLVTGKSSFIDVLILSYKNREWDGMVRELLEQRADIAIGDLTITFDREQVQKTLQYFNADLTMGMLYRPLTSPCLS